MSPERRRPHHRTVDRITALLGAATTDPRGLTLTQLAAAADAPLSSVQKLAYGLVASGFLDEHSGRYTIGPTAVVLARRSGRPLVTVLTHDDIAALHENTGAAAFLVVRVGDDAVNVDTVGLDDASAFADATRWRHPLGSTAGGRVLLAHMAERPRREWAAENLRDDPRAVELLDQLDTIRERGVAIGPSGPLRPDLEAVAVPVYQHGEVVAAVALAQSRRPGGASLDELHAALRERAPGPLRPEGQTRPPHLRSS